jgi:hypothetical protein
MIATRVFHGYLGVIGIGVCFCGAQGVCLVSGFWAVEYLNDYGL